MCILVCVCENVCARVCVPVCVFPTKTKPQRDGCQSVGVLMGWGKGMADRRNETSGWG